MHIVFKHIVKRTVSASVFIKNSLFGRQSHIMHASSKLLLNHTGLRPCKYLCSPPIINEPTAGSRPASERYTVSMHCSGLRELATK